ncbi:lysophospholipid acyltransferase family protein [Blastopirellula sp. JC732]|uniref:Lysophospholipid acyltransferase family protein n=1 Tax=Blastopirellula sediminis TaxID=2894196 RepID=A0A9X1MJM5_9BACT|nr:lysophospholipid acyltransferase family protein [Blastopirellula sediminis]MCC9607817.1 lysophospholipid acyltransferase family protein [Blastopirellula sediminis]MCC9627390.1 lysophospholipid acyltransferase family protein [Blastopirellula sediminis]
MSLKIVLDYLVYVAVRLTICIVQAIPLDRCAAIARFLAWLVSDVLKIRAKLLDSNLRHAFPEMSAAERKKLARRTWRHLLLMVCEIAHAPRKIHETNWRDYVDLKNADDKIRLLLSKRPVVILLGHLGNFEMMGYIAGILGFPTYTVARPLDNQFLHDFVQRFRGATGQFILPKQGSANFIEKTLQSGGTLGLLCDQNAGPKGCWVEFMGRPASCHKAISLFSMGSGAPLVMSYFRRTDRPMHFEMGIQGIYDPATADPQLGVKELAMWYNSHLEAMIRRNPDQYWWIHNRWRDDRPQKQKKTPAAATTAATETEGARRAA